MAHYKNFYETIEEANMRLRQSTIVYDGAPYRVLAIANHKPDGIFRIYLEPVAKGSYGMLHNAPASSVGDVPCYHLGSLSLSMGPKMDEWMESPKSDGYGVIRKHINSPKFNRFRPYPLGMANFNGSAVYVQRKPNRKSEQGLIPSMLNISVPTLSLRGNNTPQLGFHFPTDGPSFHDLVVGNYPTYLDCVTNLRGDASSNVSVAFDRNFALVKGPFGMLFLAYKKNVVGTVEGDGVQNSVRLASEYHYTREAIEELGIFSNIGVLN